MNLKIRTTSDLENLAIKKGWLPQPTHKRKTLLPKIPFYSTHCNKIFLEEEHVITKSPSTINIKERVIVAGNNFGLIYKNYFFPLGLSHAPKWVGDDYHRVTNDSVNVPIIETDLVDMTGERASLLGTTNHWGHFFVDALDRLKALADPNKKFLISDWNFMGCNSKLDQNGILPQCTSIIEALGYRIPVGNMVNVVANKYYVFDDLEVIGLLSEKPAISSDTFVHVRQLLWKNISITYKENTSTKGFLYVGRSGQSQRSVKDEDSLENFVEQSGGEVVKLGVEPLHKVISTFSNAEKIIMVIGSAKFNLLFCKPGTKVMCVVPLGYKSGVLTMFRHICLAFELDLFVYEVPILNQGRVKLHSDLIISSADLNNMLSILDKP